MNIYISTRSVPPRPREIMCATDALSTDALFLVSVI